MKLSNLAAPACTSLLWVMPASSHGASIEGLGWLTPQITNSLAHGISGDGRVVVGQVRENVNQRFLGFRWTREGGMQALATLPSADITIAYATNHDGTVVVGSTNLLTNPDRVAWRWSASDGVVSLGDFSGGALDSIARDVSDDGLTIVGVGTTGTSLRGFTWTSLTGLVQLPDLPGGSASSNARAINPDGTIIVGSSGSTNGGEATLWTNGANPVGLGDLAGSSFSSTGYGVNADGSVVVGTGRAASTGDQAMRWTQALGMVQMSNNTGIANDVSADGTIAVGKFSVAPSANGGCIWISSTSPRILTTVLSQDYGVDVTGWIIEDVTGISDDGQVIVGWGTHLPEGGQQAILVVLPRPGACCFGGVCSDNIGEKACHDGGGAFLGYGYVCASVDCTSIGACCLGDVCTDNVVEALCLGTGGSFSADALCADIDCSPDPTGACCYACPTAVGSPCPGTSQSPTVCAVMTQAQCAALSGIYAGEDEACADHCACGGDLTGDGLTSVGDFNILAGQFGNGTPDCRARTEGDLNCDGVVNVADFNILAGNYGCGS